MQEVAHPREHHGKAHFVGGPDHLVIAQRTAGLDDRGRAGFGGGEQTVGERKIGIRGDDRAASGRTLSRERHWRPRPCGAFRKVVPIHCLAYSFGWEGNEEVPPGSSLVKIDLIDRDCGTLLV